MSSLKVPVGRLFEAAQLQPLTPSAKAQLAELASQISHGPDISLHQVDQFLAQHPEEPTAQALRGVLELIERNVATERTPGNDYLRAVGSRIKLGELEGPGPQGLLDKVGLGWAAVTNRLVALLPDHSTGGRLVRAVRAGDLATIRAMKARGELNEANRAGNHAVVLAAFWGRTEALRELLGSGDQRDVLLGRAADLHVLDPVMRGTALHAAAWAGHAEACQVLIDAGLALDAVGVHNGRTALHDAVVRGNLEVVRVLLAAGADPNLVDRNGETPLALARRKAAAEPRWAALAAALEASGGQVG